jgi:circadian clock protein KaiB
MEEEENSGRANPDVAPVTAAWKLRLYINGRNSLKSIITQQNLNDFCEKYLAGRFELEVIDLIEDFARAREDKILALPTLVRRSPLPMCKIIGDLSNTHQVITALGLQSEDSNP